MSAICGVYEYANKKIKHKRLDTMHAALELFGTDNKNIITCDNIGMGCCQALNTPESLNETLPYYHDASKTMLTADCRIDNRDSLIEKTGNASTKNITDIELIIKAYQKWGTGCVYHLTGDFAFSLWDEKNKLLFCARDHFGVRPFYYYHDPEQFIFASSIRGLLAINDIPDTLCEQWIADALTTVISEKYMTPFNKIKRLPPAHYLIACNHKIDIKQYWEPDISHENNLKDEQEIKEAFREKLTNAVSRRTRSYYNVGSELSGGLDSSGMTALAAEILGPDKIHTFSHILPEKQKNKIFPFRDESSFIQQLLDHKNIKHAHFITSENKAFINAIKKSLDLHGGPTQQSFHLFADALLEKASENNVRTILSGFGGDEMVTSQGAGFLNELAMYHQWRALWSELTNGKDKKGYKPLYAWLTYYLKTEYPAMYNLLHKPFNNKDWVHKKYPLMALHKQLEQKMQQKQRYFGNKGLPKHNNVKLRQYHRITHNHVSQRLEYCALAAGSFNIEYRYPLLDKDLVTFYLSLPSTVKKHHGWGRYIYRLAMQHILPESIQWRNDKSGTTIPAVWMRFLKDSDQLNRLISQYKIANKSQYINIEKLHKQQDRLLKQQKNRNITTTPSAFFNAVKLILFQLNNGVGL